MLSYLPWLPLRLWQAVQRSLAIKLLIPVALSMLFVVGMYTYLISRLRQAWFMERMSLSQVHVRDAVSDFFLESDGQHSVEQTAAFLRKLSRDAGLAGISLQRAEAAPPCGPGEAANPAAATASPALATAFEVPQAATPPPLAVTATPQTWQSRLALPTRRQCVTCHAGSGPLATIVIAYPRDQLSAVLEGDQNHLYGYAVAVLVMVLVIVLLILWVLVLEPLYRLSAAIARVHAGDLDAACELDRADQLGRVADGFNEMLGTIRARHREERTGFETTIAHAERLATVGQLASGLAHEIKNPLHSVAGALDIIGGRLTDPELKAVARDMKGEIDRVVRIVQELLSYARPSRANKQRTDLRAVVDQTVRLLQPDAGTQHLALAIEAAPDLPAVWVDPAKLHQVLVNLILNAIQVGHSGGRVAVRLAHDHRTAQLLIEVDDDGPGIAPALAERIFEPFYTTRANGHGLGLSISRTLIEQHGGTLTLRARPGPGACFRITLPVAPVTDAQPQLHAVDLAR